MRESLSVSGQPAPDDGVRRAVPTPPGPAASPLRQLALLGALAGTVLAGLVLHAGTVEAGPGHAARPLWAPPDSTDSTDADSLGLDSLDIDALGLLTPPDSLDPDSLVADTTEGDGESSLRADTTLADSTERALRYLPGVPEAVRGYSVSIVPPALPGLRGRLGTYWRRTVTLDSAAYTYAVREAVGETDVRAPADVTFAEYLVAQRQTALAGGFRTLAQQRTDAGRRRQGVGFTVDIPGGQQSAFRTLFGRNEVDLTVSGRSDVDLGVNYNANALNEAITGQGGSVDPAFGQELNLNVAGTIGDKLRINVNYDTQSEFEFENQVSLVYTGYADDIIQRIEAGNVFLQTPSELIRGGQRLFGLRTDLQFGPLAVTAVASQQDAETTDVTIEGGSQATPFSLAPFEYEDNTHFFLGYFFHNWWDAAHQTPGLVTRPPGVNQITNIEVWKYDTSLATVQTDGAEIIYAIALADLAEPGGVLGGGQEYLDQFPDPSFTPRPDSTQDRYSETDLELLRAPNSTVVIENQFGIPITAYENTRFRRLQSDVDYTFDDQLGWISLTTPLNEDDVLAVSYEYTTGVGADQRRVYVGDFGRTSESTTDTGPRTILKLLRGDRPTPAVPLWDLTMRNVYRVGGRGLTQQAFTLGITYEAPSSPATDLLPTLTFGDQQSLLQVLGLDRVNLQNTTPPDDVFDFQTGLTVDPGNGRVIFPVRRPFGGYLSNLILTGQTLSGATVEVTPTEGSREDAAALYAYPDLYEQPRSQATRLNGISRYRISGEFRSAAQSVFNVGFNIVPSTVVVTSGGRRLAEGTDYRVNASAGTVEIINPVFLAPGQQIRVEAEQNRLFAIGSKTLLGLRANYRIAEDVGLGLTWMRLSERPLVDKFRVGEEALQNTIYGVDGQYLAEPRWVTRALDWLPLVQTSAPSRFEVRGEVAQFNPSHPQTLAFERTQRDLADAPDNLSLPDDELAGLSYVDDFEGSENSFSALGEAAGWRLAAAPDSAGPDLGPFDPGTPVTSINRPTNWRGQFGWFTLSREVYREFSGLVTPAAQPVLAGQLYQDRQFASNEERTQPLPLLDLYFDPAARGPYNYNGELTTLFASRPQDVWGGMVRPIDGSYADFEGQNNVEFIEMLVAPLGGRNGDEPIADGARLYVDLGTVSEDVIPDRRLNSEDGISDVPLAPDAQLSPYGRPPLGQPSGTVDFFRETGRTEDLGLDGLPSQAEDVAPGGENYARDEQDQFADFLGTLDEGPARQRAVDDPSADDYHHFGEAAFFEDPRFFPFGASLQERFVRTFSAPELNSIQAYSQIVQSGEEGVSNRPDTEDINGNARASTSEAFHRYELPLDAAGLAAHPFVQSTIPVGEQTFYLVRIPVRTTLRTTSAGLDSTDFSQIESIRVWTTGHDRPATLRIASFELVGSQWLKSDEVGFDVDPGAEETAGLAPSLFIESINNEESPDVYAIPRAAIRSEARSFSGTATPTREQSIVFRAENLAERRSAGIVRAYSTRPYDLTRYQNLRMFVHGEGFERRDSVRVFVRIGDDETENYYEYEQPVYPFDPASAERLGLTDNARSDSLWQTNVPLAGGERLDLNSVNIVLSELNRLKVARDAALVRGETGVAVTEPYEARTAPEGAPSGARIRIVGQPSIDDVRTVVLGVRNGSGGTDVPLDTVQVWFNELRVSGYDEAGGASGFLTANLALADLATMSARMSFTQDGFGELGGGLGTRDFADRSAFAFSANVFAHKLLPERFGWSIPVTYTLQQSGTTPRFDPERGDIRLDELADAILEDTSATALPEPDRRLAADALIERAQTVTGSRSFRVQASKTGSRSPWLRYSLDGLQAAFSSNAQTGRSPASALNTQDQWSANVGYRLTVPRPRTVRPLWFAGRLPVLGGALGGLRLNWLPQSFTFSTDLNRAVSVVQPRALLAFRSEPDSVQAFRTRRSPRQTFDHGRTMDLQYNPFAFLRLSYGSDTDQDFGAAGQTETNRILVYRPATDSTAAFTQSYDLTPDEARLDEQVRRDLLAAFPDDIPTTGPIPGFVQVLGGQTLDVTPFGAAIGNVFRGDGVRTRGYTQSLQGTFTVSTRRVRWLSWIRPQALSYRTNYGWNDIPLPTSEDNPDLRVAGARTQVQLQSGLQLVPRDFWRLFPFYRRLEAAAGRTAAGPRAPVAAAAPTDSSATSGFNPFAAAATLPRTLFLAATGVSDVSVTYRGSLSSAANGLLGGHYSLLSGLGGQAPGLGYRLGLDRTIPVGTRLNDGSLGITLEDRLGDQHALEGRTTLEPFPSLRIGLVMQTQWTRETSTTYDSDDAGAISAGLPNTRGTGTSTVYAFGSSYESLVARQTDRFDRDTGRPANDDGSFTSDVLTRNGLAQDFQAEFGRGLGRYGPGGVFPIPVPGWDVTFTGLGRFPVFRALAQQVTLRHNYSATAQTAYSALPATTTGRDIGTGPDAITLVPPVTGVSSDEVTTLTASQAFQPLVGVQVTWKGGLQTSLNWERSDLYTLQTSAAQLTSKRIENLRLELTWAKTGFRLLGLRRLNNNLTFNLSGSIFNDETIPNRPLSVDVANAITGAPLAEVSPVRTRRYQITPRLGYTISNQVTASVFVDYTQSEAQNGISTTDLDGGVSLRILFSN